MISAVTPSLHIIEALEQELSALDLQLRRIAAGDELCRRFMAVPCIGPVTAVTVAAYMGDPQRFRNGRHCAAYLGVAPKHAGSGGRTVITGVGGAGMAPARRVLHEAAPIMLCWNRARAAAGEEHLVSPWIARLDAAHPVRESACAIANRLARILHAVARSAEGYDPRRHHLVRRLKGDAPEAGTEVMTP